MIEPAHQLEAKTWAVGCGTAVDLRLKVEEAKGWLNERDDCQKVMLLSWCGNDFVRKTRKKKYYDTDPTRMGNFRDMISSAKRNGCEVILVGLGTARCWGLPEG